MTDTTIKDLPSRNTSKAMVLLECASRLEIFSPCAATNRSFRFTRKLSTCESSDGINILRFTCIWELHHYGKPTGKKFVIKGTVQNSDAYVNNCTISYRCYWKGNLSPVYTNKAWLCNTYDCGQFIIASLKKSRFGFDHDYSWPREDFQQTTFRNFGDCTLYFECDRDTTSIYAVFDPSIDFDCEGYFKQLKERVKSLPCNLKKIKFNAEDRQFQIDITAQTADESPNEGDVTTITDFLYRDWFVSEDKVECWKNVFENDRSSDWY